MERIEALLILVRDARSPLSSATSCKRVLRAIKALGLDESDKIALLADMDYCDYDGTPYKWYAEVLSK